MPKPHENLSKANREKLLPKDELIAYLDKWGANDRALSDIREQYTELLGDDPFWRYPISECEHAGGIIVPVKEGFLWLPYNEMDEDDYEIYLTKDAHLLGAEACEVLAKEFQSYATALCDVLRFMATELAQEGGQ